MKQLFEKIFSRIPAENTCSKLKMKKTKNKKKTTNKPGNTLILLKVNNKDSRIKCNAEFPKTFLNNDK